MIIYSIYYMLYYRYNIIMEKVIEISNNTSNNPIYFFFIKGTIGYGREKNAPIYRFDTTKIEITEGWISALLTTELSSDSNYSIVIKGKPVPYTFNEFKKYYDFFK